MSQTVSNPVTTATLIAGFEEPIQQSQQVFRSVLKAMSEPGTLVQINHAETTPVGFDKSTWQLALSLFDADTNIWLSPSLRQSDAICSNLRFHCQSPLTDSLADADFALCNADEVPALSDLNWGDAEYPDQSTTLVVQVPAISNEPFWQLTGPGIETERGLRIAGLTERFRNDLAASRLRFPLGIDSIYCCDETLVALPRTTLITEETR